MKKTGKNLWEERGVVPPRIERGSKVPETFVVSILLRDHAINCDYGAAKIRQRGGQFGRPFEIIGQLPTHFVTVFRALPRFDVPWS